MSEFVKTTTTLNIWLKILDFYFIITLDKSDYLCDKVSNKPEGDGISLE